MYLSSVYRSVLIKQTWNDAGTTHPPIISMHTLSVKTGHGISLMFFLLVTDQEEKAPVKRKVKRSKFVLFSSFFKKIYLASKKYIYSWIKFFTIFLNNFSFRQTWGRCRHQGPDLSVVCAC